MENKRVDFTTAKLAKEKGFDFYDTGGYYHINEGYSSGYAFCYSDVNEQTEGCLLCPDQSLLQKWLREKYQLFICVKHKITGSVEEPIIEFLGENNIVFLQYFFTTNGQNIRNNVAHAFYRFNNYSPIIMMLLICTFLKLGNFKLKDVSTEVSEEASSK